MTEGRDFGNSGEKSFSRAAGMEAELGRAECQVAGHPDEPAELDQEFLGTGELMGSCMGTWLPL